MSSTTKTIRLLLNGGDNMLGRGIQLSCWHQSIGDDAIMDSMPAKYYLQKALHPSAVSSTDLKLDEIRELNRHGKYTWGDYLGLKIDPAPVLRLLNLETAVTCSIHNPDVPRTKGINYHLHCDNLPEIMEGFTNETHGGRQPAPFVLCYANNHCLDFGRQAFEQETLPLMRSRFNMVGAGTDLDDAARPFQIQIGDSFVQVFAVATAWYSILRYFCFRFTFRQCYVSGFPTSTICFW
jgi:hypothetical protein